MKRALAVVCGATGSGKSFLALELARRFSGEIINCDSLQVYRYFNVGTAKLSLAERGGIRHHLIDAVEPGEGFTAGDFCRLCREALAEISGRGSLAILCGGTGFYIRALLDGLSPGPPRDEGLRNRLSKLEARQPGRLHRLLHRWDAASAARIHAHDVPKLIRAIEICVQSRGSASAQPPRTALRGYGVFKLGLFPERGALYQLLDRRCEEMLRGELIEEIESILAAGVPIHAKPFESIGYKQALAVIEGRMSFDAALAEMQRDTRRYAKRQMTWFRHEPGLEKLEGFGTEPNTIARAAAAVEDWLDRGGC